MLFLRQIFCAKFPVFLQSKMFSAKVMAKQMLNRHRLGSTSQMSRISSRRGGMSETEDEHESIISGTSSTTQLHNSNEYVGNGGNSFVTAPPKISISSAISSPRSTNMPSAES